MNRLKDSFSSRQAVLTWKHDTSGYTPLLPMQTNSPTSNQYRHTFVVQRNVKPVQGAKGEIEPLLQKKEKKTEKKGSSGQKSPVRTHLHSVHDVSNTIQAQGNPPRLFIRSSLVPRPSLLRPLTHVDVNQTSLLLATFP